MTTFVVGNWRLDEGKGLVAGDSTGNRNNGQLSPLGSPPIWTDGRKPGSTALHFDGTNFVKTGSNPTLAVLESSSVTVEAWAKSDNPNAANLLNPLNAYILAKGAYQCTSASYAMYAETSGELFFHIYQGDIVSLSPGAEPSAVWDGQWHHLAGTYDGNIVRLYVDGQEIGNGNQVAPPTAIVYDLPVKECFIGSYESTSCHLRFTGDIAEVRVWNGALSASEVLMRAQGQELT